MNETVSLKQKAIRHLERHHSELYGFWMGSNAIPQVSLEAHCDLVYSLFLLGSVNEIHPSAVTAFGDYARALHLPCYGESGPATVSVHNCAYLFGALNLLRRDGEPHPLAAVVDVRKLSLQGLVDPATQLPLFPAKWTHHNWRVSHWLGGIPSLLLSLERSGMGLPSDFDGISGKVRSVLSALVDNQTGLIRAYKSQAVQRLFRIAYGLRHDPDLGDLGGIAHILWVDHALGRRYTAPDNLLSLATDQFLSRAPFMEKVPYCLDFDIVQIVRTAAEQLGVENEASRQRARAMMGAIDDFFDNPSSTYTLHKLPGALATYHECALLCGEGITWLESGQPVDIIQHANWL